MKVIYFDGVCNLCNGFISFLMTLGLPADVKVSSLQGDYAKANLEGKIREELSSVIYQTPEGIYKESTAVIYILADLKAYLRILKIFLLVPRILRDFLYRMVARNRYKLFGKRDTCRLPNQEELEYFI